MSGLGIVCQECVAADRITVLWYPERIANFADQCFGEPDVCVKCSSLWPWSLSSYHFVAGCGSSRVCFLEEQTHSLVHLCPLPSWQGMDMNPRTDLKAAILALSIAGNLHEMWTKISKLLLIVVFKGCYFCARFFKDIHYRTGCKSTASIRYDPSY